MDKNRFKNLIRECIEEVLMESGVKQLDKHGNWVEKPGGLTTPTPSSKPGTPPKIDFNKQRDDLKQGSDWLLKHGVGGVDENKHPLTPYLEGDGTDMSKQTAVPPGRNVEEDPMYVEYHSERQGEEPFMMNGTKFQFVNAKYPNGKIDIGVYSFAGDMVLSYATFRRQHNLKEGDSDKYKMKSPPPPKIRQSWGDLNPVSRIHGQGKQGNKPKYDRNRAKTWKKDLDEMTGTAAVQGFYGKNWVDPDPERKKMKAIASKSVGGKVSQ